jgi:hypothetical protein
VVVQKLVPAFDCNSVPSRDITVLFTVVFTLAFEASCPLDTGVLSLEIKELDCEPEHPP